MAAPPARKRSRSAGQTGDARHGDPNRRVARDRAIGEVEVFDLHGGESSGDGGRRDNCLRHWSFRQDNGLAGEKIGGDHMQRKLRILQVAVRDVGVD